MWPLIYFICIGGVIYLLRREHLIQLREYKEKYGYSRKDFIRMKHAMRGSKRVSFSEWLEDYFLMISK